MISGTDAATIRSALGAVASNASAPASLILIGGCNLAVREIKTSTKDVDLVLHDAADPPDVLRAFHEAGFDPVDGYYFPGAPLDPHTMLEDDRGVWIDLFLPERLFGDLSYSQAMARRESVWFAAGVVTVALADPATVFLLKAVTGRWRSDPERDIPDLAGLLDRGVVDWDFLRKEWFRQVAGHPSPEQLRDVAREALARLAALGYRRIPWTP